MWFKNLTVYQFTQPFTLSAEQLEERLAGKPFRRLGKHELEVRGWEAPLGKGSGLRVHAVGDCLLLCARTEEKILPPAAVRDALNARIEALEEKEQRKLKRTEKQALKEAIVLEMIPRAFSRTRSQYAYIDKKNQYLIIDCAATSQAERFLGLLRDTLEQLPVVPWHPAKQPLEVMTYWLERQQAARGFTLGEECELRDKGENAGIVRIRKQDLESAEIQAHLQAGKQVSQLALCFEERLSFVLDAAFRIKRLRFLDGVLDELEHSHSETQAERFDADFALMSLELSNFLPLLLTAFGGAKE